MEHNDGKYFYVLPHFTALCMHESELLLFFFKTLLLRLSILSRILRTIYWMEISKKYSMLEVLVSVELNAHMMHALFKLDGALLNCVLTIFW
jgi:hypothetical protein